MSRFRSVNTLSRNFRDGRTPGTAEDSIFSFLFKDLRDELKGIRECYEKANANYTLLSNQIAIAEKARQEDYRNICQSLSRSQLGIYILCVGCSLIFVESFIGWKEMAYSFIRQMKHDLPVLKKARKE